MPHETKDDESWMRRAIELAKRGEGCVEPNPMVGCVLVLDGEVIGEGWHQKFGEAHAEVNALADVTGGSPTGATAYVSLEPCSHHGKTPPCSQALIAAKISRVIIAHLDPNLEVAGAGVRELEAAGIEVTTGLLESEAREVLAPYLKRTETGLPWVIAKWAMTLDGKIASTTGSSQWISNELSRSVVHDLRGRVDGIMVGSGTALADDPLLTARPVDPANVLRTPLRVVVDSSGSLPSDSQLCKTAAELGTLVAVGKNCSEENQMRLRDAGCKIWLFEEDSHNERLLGLLKELGQLGVTNLMVEGGAGLLGSLFEMGQIDEVHAFVAAKLIGGANAATPIGGAGKELMTDASQLKIVSTELIEDDFYLVARKLSSQPD